MAISKRIAIVILGTAFLLYPQSMHASVAAPSHHMLAGHSDGVQPGSSHPADMSGNPAPLCSATSGMCVTLLAPIPTTGPLAGPLAREGAPPAANLENRAAPAPHPPNSAG